jgi:NAD(P)-dependent dehydrogenase (short-subunit alcohol dehydrogenase family)
LALAENGFAVAGVDIAYDPAQSESGLFEVKQRMSELQASFLPLQGDIASLEGHERILETVGREFGRIDVLVNNAGVAPEERLDVLETTPESYDRLMAVNTRGPFFFTQKAAKRMMAAANVDRDDHSCIVFISSISAEVSSPSRAEYCISKAGVSQMARVFADRLSGSGINVYEIRPGIIQTDMTAGVKEKYDRLIAEGIVPQGRWGFPEDVGKAVAALVRGDFAYSTGMVLEVSGGMDIRRL